MENGALDRYRLEELERDIEPLRPLPGQVDAIRDRVKADEERVDVIEGKLDRLTLAIVTLAITIAGSAIAIALTVGSGPS